MSAAPNEIRAASIGHQSSAFSSATQPTLSDFTIAAAKLLIVDIAGGLMQQFWDRTVAWKDVNRCRNAY